MLHRRNVVPSRRRCLILAFILSLSRAGPLSGEEDISSRAIPFSCDVAEAIITNTSELGFDLRYGLRGIRLKVGVSDLPPFSSVHPSRPYGVGDGLRFRGPAVVLLDNMAREFGVEIEFLQLPPLHLVNNSVSEYIVKHVKDYDLLTGPFLSLENRRKQGVVFTTGVMDFSLQLYMLRPKPLDLGIWDNAFFWVWPFELSGYAVVLVIWIVPSLLLWQLEKDHIPGSGGFVDALVRGFLIIVGVKGALLAWKPRSKYGRGIAALWAVLALVVTYLYLATLTRWMIHEGLGITPVQSVRDFVSRGHRLCISQNMQMQELAQRFVDGKFFPTPKSELPMALTEGKCQGFLEKALSGRVFIAGGQPQMLPPDGSAPYGCSLKPVGRPVVELSGAYATELRGCKSIITDVVSTWIQGKKEDATIRRLVQRMVDEAGRDPGGEPRCPSNDVSAGKPRLKAGHLMGLVVVTLVPMLGMFAAALIEDRLTQKTNAKPGPAGETEWTMAALLRRNAELEAAIALHASALSATLSGNGKTKAA